MPKRLPPVLAALLVLLVPALAFAQGGGFEDQLARGWLWAHLAVFGAGFLTSLTPCVYPMIPIVVGVFGARDEDVTRQKAFALASAYVLGMGAMYAVLGIVFALIGKQFGSILSDPKVVFPIVALYLALAASMFGAFELNLPASLQARLSRVGGRGYGGAFGMGLVGGLTAAPCTGPILVGILGYVATTRDVVAGASLLFTYAIGMGVLFWLLAAFTVSLPKSGRWMESVKSFGGIALLAVSIFFLRPIFPAIAEFGGSELSVLALAIGLIVLGIALGAIHLSFHAGWPVRIRKGLGVLFTVVGLTLAVNWTLSAERELPWHYDEQAAFAAAEAEDKGVMIDFAADWCTPCAELELTFATDEVYEALSEDYVFLKFDVSKGTEEDEAKQEKWNAETLPAVVFTNAAGEELGRVSEYLKPAPFLAVVQAASAKLRGHEPEAAAATPAAAAELAAVAAEPAAAQASADDIAVPAAGAATVKGAAEDTADKAEVKIEGHGELSWRTDERAAFAEAAATGKRVVVDFHGTWCTGCVEMDENAWSEPAVASVIDEAFVPLRLDVTEGNPADEALQAKYEADSLPMVIVVDTEGVEHGRLAGAASSTDLIGLLTTCSS